jgi:transposase
MISFTGALKIYLALDPCDMRKSFNGLYGLAEAQLGEDPRSGALFVFCNKRRNRIKTLYFDGTGIWISAKRLERGCFNWPKASRGGQSKMRLAPEALQLLLDGVDLRGAQLRAWYEREEKSA